MDEEAPGSCPRPRSRWIHGFLVASLGFILALIAAGAVVGAWLVMDVKSQLSDLKKIGVGHESDSSGYKTQNFARLEVTDGNLKNGTMTWSSVKHLADSSVGSKFVFDDRQHTLHPTKEGHYFMFLDFTFSCTFICNATRVTVELGDQLTCHMDIPAGTAPVTRKCWTVAYMDGKTRLAAHMSVPGKKEHNWSLKLTESKMGMFLVD